MRKIMKNKLIWIAAGAFVIILFFIIRGCGSNKSVMWEFDKVTVGEVAKTIAVTGKLDLYESYLVTSMVDGIVTKIYVDFNKNVGQGTALAYIESMTTDQKVLTQNENLKKVRLEMENQAEFLDAKKKLYAENMISKKEYEMTERSYQLALSNYNQTRLIYSKFLEEQRAKNINAPVSGVIINMWAELRKPVTMGTPLFLIAPTMKKMKLLITVDESDVGIVQKGQSIEFNVSAYPEKRFHGTIEQVRIQPKTTGTITTYESLAVCDNPEELLRPGMTANAVVKINKKDGVLRVPNQALIVTPKNMEVAPGKRYIWIRTRSIKDKIPVKRIEVKTGLEGDTFTEITTTNIKKGEDILVGYYNKDNK